ncbi:IPT/TIG domain-containing protein [Kitasatospora sp. NPDC004669]|uniref:IPT/TIG domain-containing protein n=1 Tax=Kitasatospora sp. NPDC004669 TaxID=3154555 RepID=UPI0033A97893
MGQFAYGGPAPVEVGAVGPTGGKVGTPVTIGGSGFADGATVHFKDRASDSVAFVSTKNIQRDWTVQTDEITVEP